MDGRMLFFLCIAASVIAVTHSQDYTRRFPFVPGRFLVPEDGVPVPFPNRVYVQLPNTTDVLEARIREGVNTTLDCGLYIDLVTSFPFTRNHYTYWTLHVRRFNGSLVGGPGANVTAGESSDFIEIFGDNDRFLRSPNPQLASSARQSNIGVFTCHFCYEEFNILNGSTLRSLCDTSSTDVNIIGTPPRIDRNDSTTPGITTIGRTVCLNIGDPDRAISVNCAQIGTITPQPTTSFTFNGNPIDINFFILQGSLVIFTPNSLPTQGELNCVLMNRFGNDTESTLLLYNATSDFSGTINGVSGSQCPANTPSNVLCPRNGQQVNLNCATNFMNSINITSPDSTTVTNRNLSFTVGPNDRGTYTCTGFNECNQSPSTVVLQQCRLPQICTVGPRRGGSDSEPIQNHCFSNIQTISGAVIDCDAKFDCSDDDAVRINRRMWFINGVLQPGQDRFSIQISDPGTYTCVVNHTCGIIQSRVASVPRDPPAITTGTSTVSNPSGPVTVGNTVCLDASASNPSVQLDCVISNPVNSSLTNITWSPGGTTQEGVTSASLTVTSTGTYTCTAANDCGTTNASTLVRNTPAVNITGSVDGISGDGCSGAGSGKRICANVGMSVTISCAVGPGDTYTITGPGQSATNQPLTFTVADNSFGDFTCNSTNSCGSVTDTIRLERADCPLPNVTVSVQRGNGAIHNPPCLRSDNDVFVSCADSLSGSSVAWYINGVLQTGNTGSRQRATTSGNYTCVTTSTCGSVTNTTFIKEPPTVASGSGIDINPGNNPVFAGTNTCISRTGGGSSVNLVCNLVFNNESVSVVTFSWSTPGRGSSTGPSITASSTGDYTCTASNPCGSSQATTQVLGHIEQIQGTGTSIDQTVDIGTRLCLNSNNPATINCNTAFGTNVTRTWFRGNNVISGVTGSSYSAMPSDIGSTITCRVANPCGMIMASTQVISQVPVNISGRIPALNISDNGCNRPGITSTNVDLCPLDGERVEISCSSTEGYTINGPGGSSTDTPLVIPSFSLSDSGRYICTSRNTDCGAAMSSILISGSGVPPSISTNPPGTPTPTLPPTIMNATIPIGTDICLLDHQFVTIDCRTESGTEPITFTWTAASNRSRVISNGMSITVNNTDVYTCNASNAFGTSAANSRVERRLDVSLVGISPQGSRCDQLKRRPPGVDYCAYVGDSLTLSCRVNAPNITTMIYIGGTSRGDIPLTPVLPSAEGNYLCNATNDCGTSTDMLNLRVYDPARIDRQQTLPPAGPNEEVIGAGRPDEPNEVTPGRTVRLFCPFTGIDPANTTWLRVRPDGFTTEIDTSLSAFSINNTGNVSVLTISPFTREFEGTYRCTTTNIAGDDAGDVVLQATVEVIPEWVTSPWSECEPKCHRGMRMRLVHCVDRLSGRRLPDNRCTESKPLTMESCVNSGPCFTTPKWNTGNWTSCSVACGGGHRTRPVTCVIPLTGETVPDSKCTVLRKPRDHEYCNDHSCCVSDAYKACKYIAGTHSCSYGYMRTICCWTCRHYHYY